MGLNLTFGIVIVIAVLIDLGLLSKKHRKITIKKALYQTGFWVFLSLAFCGYLYFNKEFSDQSAELSLKYLAAYLMEWSLSIDNIFVFLLIFSFYKVAEDDAGRALLIGILLAIIFRIIFISLGIALIERISWIMYLFGLFILYSGIKLFFQKHEDEYDPANSKIYQFTRKIFRLTDEEPRGKFIITHREAIYFTRLSMVVLMLGFTDIVFALDSIPTVVSLVRDSPAEAFTAQEKLIIYSSNIFAVLGLRSLFFLLKGAVDKFEYLKHGIAIVLVFIGLKMLLEKYVPIPIYVSLIVIVICLLSAIIYSIKMKGPIILEQEDRGEA